VENCDRNARAEKIEWKIGHVGRQQEATGMGRFSHQEKSRRPQHPMRQSASESK